MKTRLYAAPAVKGLKEIRLKTTGSLCTLSVGVLVEFDERKWLLVWLDISCVALMVVQAC